MVGRVIADEIGRGEGANFVIKRRFQARIDGYARPLRMICWLLSRQYSTPEAQGFCASSRPFWLSAWVANTTPRSPGTFGLDSAQVIRAGGELTTNGLLDIRASEWTNSSVLQAGRLNVQASGLQHAAVGPFAGADVQQAIGGQFAAGADHLPGIQAEGAACSCANSAWWTTAVGKSPATARSLLPPPR